jgi:hypothetical protein
MGNFHIFATQSKNMIKVFRAVVYQIIFAIAITPIMNYFDIRSIWILVSGSFILAFFAGFLNDIWGVLDSINDKLDKK